jgi:hypothetical protein
MSQEDLEARLTRFLALAEESKSPNDTLHQSKEYLNPYTNQRIVEYFGIQEHGSNYPAELYNWQTVVLHEDEYYDRLGERQKELMQHSWRRGFSRN